MKDRVWLVIVGVATAEGFVFEFEPELGWAFVMAILVASIPEVLRNRGKKQKREEA